MSEEMQQDAVDCATQALEKYNIEKVGRPYLAFILVLYVMDEKRIRKPHFFYI